MPEQRGSKTLERLLRGRASPPLSTMLTNEALDLVLLFDTTGSMYRYLERVRAKLAELAREIFSAVPDTRVGIVAFGDYCDAGSTYVVKVLGFTSDVTSVRDFIVGVESTGGGDQPEAIEEALFAANQLSWRVGARRAVVLVGDAPPHGVIDPKVECRYGHYYLDEASALAKKAVRVYGVQCGNGASAEQSFREIAAVTRGKYLQLEEIDDLIELLVAICMKEVGLLAAYTGRLADVKQMTSSRERLLAALDDDK